MRCGRCKGEGHKAEECPNGFVMAKERPPRQCGNCGERGHYTTTCAKPKKRSGRCRFCGADGHDGRTCGERGAALVRREEQDRAMSAMFSRKPSVPTVTLRREVYQEEVIPCTRCRKPIGEQGLVRLCPRGCGSILARCVECALEDGIEGARAMRLKAEEHASACGFERVAPKRSSSLAAAGDERGELERAVTELVDGIVAAVRVKLKKRPA